MGWRMVHIKEGDFLRLKLDNIEITKLHNKVYIPLSDINMIVLEGNRTSITTKLLSSLSKNDIGLVICDDKYLPTGIYLPFGQYHHTAKRVIAQAQWTSHQKASLWKAIISQKIFNQIDFVRLKNINIDRIELMQQLANQLEDGDPNNREGIIAKVYFDSLFGKSFTRNEENIINYALNFGYAIVRSCIARIVVGNGLVPMLGIFHCNEFNSFNLVDDLMEPFRPIMDYWIDQIIPQNEEYLTYESRIKIIEFMNQSIIVNNRTLSVDNAMKEFIQSFIFAMQNEDPQLLLKIKLENFVRN